MTKQKVLILDIETRPVEAYVWDLHDQNIALNQIIRDWGIIAWAAKWLGDPADKVIYMDARKDPYNDLPILKPLWKLLDEADIVITQNGARFDGPKINARFVINGMKPPSPYKHLDTYLIARRTFGFTSNKLEYMTAALNEKYKKLSHAKFPGQSLWNECLKGNKAAWDEMRTYNIHDVLSTEELYTNIRAWAPPTAPKPHIKVNNSHCDTCGVVGKVQSRGAMVTKTAKYQRLHCQACGTWSKGEKL